MKRIRTGLIVLSLLFCSATFAGAQVSIGIGLPNLSIGINLPLYPDLTPVPGYPVYYAPQVHANYFFYDGMYWVYHDDNWYASTWYNGPWAFVEPYAVPLFVLRIPVRYYRQPPVYFRGWPSNAPPRWGQHWGRDWEHRRRGWDRWNRSSVPARAPRPSYQREYSGDRYPRHVEQQHELRSRSYRYQPRDRAVRQHIRQQPGQRTSAPPERRRQEAPPVRDQRQMEQQRPAPLPQGAPPGSRPQPQQRGREDFQRPSPPQQSAPAVREQRQQREQRPQIEQRQQREQRPQIEQRQQREQPQPRPQVQEQRPQGRGEPRERDRGRGQGQGKDDDRGRGQGQDRDDDRGRGRDR